VPNAGETLEHDGIRFTVLETDGNRIDRLEVEFAPEAKAQEHEAEQGPEADQAA